MRCCSRQGNNAALLTAATVSVVTPLIMIAVAGQPGDPPAQGAPSAAHHPADVLRYEMNRIDGTPEKLDSYRGRVVMLVNTASECGLTPQYEALETIYREREDRGFVVLGFPANDFMGQEPGTNEQIAAFCTERFDVTFPMFEKITVTGKDKHPLYEQLAELPEPLGGEPKWNFTKFLIDRRGRVVERFEPRIKPDDERVIEAIERLLAQKAEPGSDAEG